MQQLSSFFNKSIGIISQKTKNSINALKNDLDVETYHENKSWSKENKDNLSKQKDDHLKEDTYRLAFEDNSITQRASQDLQLQESKVTQLEPKMTPSMPEIKKKRSIKINTKPLVSQSRIRQIEQEKKRILEQLKKLDNEIVEIKKQQGQFDSDRETIERSYFHKKTGIADDAEAKRQAQSLIKQLHLQKKKIQEKKRKQQQLELQKIRKQDEERKKQREEMQRKLKEEKRHIIEKRLQEDCKRREQRKLLDKQSNILINELKKQSDLENQHKIIPKQLQEYEQKKKLVEKKVIFNYQDIQEHQKKYQQMKSLEKQTKRERQESVKLSKPSVPKYGKNIWIQKLEEENQRKKEEEKMKELSKKMQLEKRIQYGAAVKSMFLSKFRKRQESTEKIRTNEPSVIQQQKLQQPQNVQNFPEIKKPQTPNPQSNLPPIKKELRQNQTDKKFKSKKPQQQSIQSKPKSRIISKSKKEDKDQVKQKDPEEQQRIRKQKQREAQLRRQTKERLKKLQSHSIDIPKSEKVRYENYMQKVKVKKQSPNEEWKKIMSNERLSKQQKYKEMINKAAHMQNQAKIKEDLRKNGDQDAVNLYIGSIQAKLALLEKF